MMNEITALSFCQRFVLLTYWAKQSEILQLLKVLRVRRVRVGEYLLREGVYNDSLFLLWSGQLSVTCIRAGERHVLGICEPGEWVGETGVLAPGSSRFNVVATQNSVALQLDVAAKKELEKRVPKYIAQVLKALCVILAQNLKPSSQFSAPGKECASAGNKVVSA